LAQSLSWVSSGSPYPRASAGKRRAVCNPRALARRTILLALLLLTTLSATASAETRYRVIGGGFGHGVGMSQWGAYGYAKHGTPYRDIATHYFKGTKVGRVKASRTIRVLLGTDPDASFTGAKRACGTNLRPSRTYRAAMGGDRIRLERGNGKRLARCGGKLVAKGASGPIRIGGQGAFRGDLVTVAKSGKQYVVNQLGIDDYVKGVVPNEMPPSWPLAALQTQALTARSYALATDAGGRIFDQYDDTRSQVYGGIAGETAATNEAVRKSRRQVLEFKGEVIPAFYSSSSGGRTENVEFGFPGTEPKPYLKSVRDPYDDASPDHRWRESFSRGEMESMLSGLVPGRFRGIKVTKRGVSPRIVAAKVLGTRGATRVTGSDLVVRLGLRSSWAKFKRVR